MKDKEIKDKEMKDEVIWILPAGIDMKLIWKKIDMKVLKMPKKLYRNINCIEIMTLYFAGHKKHLNGYYYLYCWGLHLEYFVFAVVDKYLHWLL